MEIWFTYALLAAVGSGLYGFISKVSSEKKYDSDVLFLHSYFWKLVFCISLLFYISPNSSGKIVGLIFAMALTSEILYYFSSKIRIKSFKYIDSALYFPLYKTIGPVLVIIAGIFIFNENLSSKEWLGVILGIVTSLLLITRNDKKDQNLKKGFTLVVLSTLLAIGSYVISKYVIVLGISVEWHITLGALFGIMVALSQKRKSIKKSITLKNTKKGLAFYGFLNGLSAFVSVYFGILALVGNMAVVYTIASFSILITIILSVIFYKEKLNTRRIISIFLSILVLLLFV